MQFRRVHQRAAQFSALVLVFSTSVFCAAQTRAQASFSHGVIYQNGQLTINSEGSSLAEVLQSVAGKIGAVIELPEGAGNERIIQHAGPGSADEVLTALLSGSEFNFVIVTSPSSPHVPTRVLLTPRSGSSAGSTEVASAASAPAAPADPSYGTAFSEGEPDNQPAMQQQTENAHPLPVNPSTGEQMTPDQIEQMVKDHLKQRHAQQQTDTGASPVQ